MANRDATIENDDAFFAELSSTLNQSLTPSPERDALIARVSRVALEHKFFHKIFNICPDPIYLKDAEGRYLLINQAVRKYFKLAPDEALNGRTDFDFLDRKHAELYRLEDSQVFNGLNAVNEKIQPVSLPDGSEAWVKTTKTVILDNTGEPRCVGGYSREFSDHNHGTEFLKSVLANARCIIWTAQVNKVDKEFQWKTTVLSSSLSRSEIGLHEHGSTLWDNLISPEEAARMNAMAQQALQRRAAGYEHDFAIKGLDGEMRNLKEVVRITPVNSTEWNLVGVAMDVTAQEQAERELQQSLSIVSATIESSDDGILVVNSQGKIVFFNTRFAEMWCIPNHVIMSGDDEQAFAYAANLLTDPDSFLQRIQDAYTQPDAVIYDMLKFNDGRVFERHSHPQRDGGHSVGRVWVFRDISKRARMEEQLAAANARLIKLVKEDVLTGLLNRRTVLESSELEWSRWQRTRKPFSVLLLDVDDFKKINDVHGHLTGDRALKMIADSLKDSIRGLDMVGRYGGEEFIIILPETPIEGAEVVGEKVLQNIRTLKLTNGLTHIPLTASMGVAAARAEDKDIDALIHRADSAMYTAKRGGKNQLRSVVIETK